MKELIGKTITGLFVNEDQSALMFTHPDNEKTCYETEADCCSETWFADITGVGALLDSTVLEVEEVKLPSDLEDQDKRTRQEYDEFYGVKLKTTRGHVDIVYRNSSNGYYGGEIEYKVQGLPEGCELTPITDDWSA
jgi:hypothetical protein